MDGDNVQVQFYKIISKILNNSKKSFDLKAIRSEILKESVYAGCHFESEETDDEKYCFLIRSYLDIAITYGDSDAFSFFREVFYDNFASGYGRFWATYYAVNLVGLYSLCELAVKHFFEKKYSIKPGFIFHLNIRAYLESPLIILGETGTGKELMGKVIHTLSSRRHKPYQEINCAAIPEKMLESELFGYEQGAFTDANKRKLGLLELANGGMIFLDEIGKMSTRLQAKILRAIEEKKFFRLGGDRSIQIDVRFIAAMQPCNMNGILPDLLYRLGYPDVINLPTLNETLDEVGEIVIKKTLEKVVDKVTAEYSRGTSTAGLPPYDKMTEYPVQIDKKCLHLLLNHKYKGNYRELENILRGAFASYMFSPKEYLSSEDLNFINDIDEDQNAISEEDKIQPLSKNKRIKLKEIIKHADKVWSSIIEEKVKEVLRQGIDVKAALAAEGLPEKEYQNYWKKLIKATGKSIRVLKREAYLSNG
jgi:hypothetical protein